MKGSYQVNIVAIERNLGVTNREAVFIVEAYPQLKVKSRPAELDAEQKFKVNEAYQLPVPTYYSDNHIRYDIVEKDEELAPLWISIRTPRAAAPYVEIKCEDIPIKNIYEFELTASDHRQHVEDV